MAVNLESKTLLGNWVEEVNYILTYVKSQKYLFSGNVLVSKKAPENQTEHYQTLYI